MDRLENNIITDIHSPDHSFKTIFSTLHKVSHCPT